MRRRDRVSDVNLLGLWLVDSANEHGFWLVTALDGLLSAWIEVGKLHIGNAGAWPHLYSCIDQDGFVDLLHELCE